ncbi:YeiH family protein [Aquabacter spiritensis]|uniref:Putative integral membrane protein (TIGR00698 family) n=1 Tax=Aquabacter spiritensis TaxID=933073 RepID=A0A4R3LWY6_9HYPH|nr:YeiH family protein [Aquabacter spiritensis]TCT05141.1 putative integral membrane protein (TIGR00698 family) [Aquabacter spiritensis]
MAEKSAAPPAPERADGWRAGTGVLPGLVLTAAIAGLAYALRLLPVIGVLSPLVIATVVGMTFHNLVGTPAWAIPGVKFALRRILRFAIILLGLQLTFAQVRMIGPIGFGIVAFALFATFFVTRWMGRLMGVDPKLSELIAAGTAICGASAVVATNTVTRGSDEDVAYAVACVTVFGSAAMLLSPVLLPVIGFAPHAYGLWVGASVHEVAQVVAAAFQGGQAAGEFGTVAKLTRVMLLAPLVLGLGFVALRRARGTDAAGKAAPPVPWFVLGFMAMIVVNSFGLVPAEAKPALVQTTTFLLALALGAMGLETDIRKLKAKGWRPLALGAAAWLFIAGLTFGLIDLLGA